MEYKGYEIRELSKMECVSKGLVFPTVLILGPEGNWINDCESVEEAKEFIDRMS